MTTPGLEQFAPADSWMALSRYGYQDLPGRVYPGVPGTHYDGPRWPWLTGPTKPQETQWR